MTPGQIVSVYDPHIKIAYRPKCIALPYSYNYNLCKNLLTSLYLIYFTFTISRDSDLHWHTHFFFYHTSSYTEYVKVLIAKNTRDSDIIYLIFPLISFP